MQIQDDYDKLIRIVGGAQVYEEQLLTRAENEIDKIKHEHASTVLKDIFFRMHNLAQFFTDSHYQSKSEGDQE